MPDSAPRRIRTIALGLIQDDRDRLFVYEGHDPTTQQAFYRALGGGIEFGESSQDALQREFLEEIQADLTNIHYLGCLENRFTYGGKPHHEIVQLYRCDFADAKFYSLDRLTFTELNSTSDETAFWVACDRFRSGELRLVPEQCLAFL